jgi:hypothetical protein
MLVRSHEGALRERKKYFKRFIEKLFGVVVEKNTVLFRSADERGKQYCFFRLKNKEVEFS